MRKGLRRWVSWRGRSGDPAGTLWSWDRPALSLWWSRWDNSSSRSWSSWYCWISALAVRLWHCWAWSYCWISLIANNPNNIPSHLSSCEMWASELLANPDYLCAAVNYFMLIYVGVISFCSRRVFSYPFNDYHFLSSAYLISACSMSKNRIN